MFPTPIDHILNVAKVEEVKEDVLNPSFVEKMRAKAGGYLKSAVSKVIGLFDAVAGLIFLDHSLYLPKRLTASRDVRGNARGKTSIDVMEHQDFFRFFLAVIN